jgi:hypothetical protein
LRIPSEWTTFELDKMEVVMNRSSLEEPRIRSAFDAFEAAMDHSSDERLWLLHSGLEKMTMRIVRGSWGGADRQACPLTTLYVGVPHDDRDARRGADLAKDHLRRVGFQAADFYKPWDEGLISARELLRFVDRELTRRTMNGQIRQARNSRPETPYTEE